MIAVLEEWLPILVVRVMSVSTVTVHAVLACLLIAAIALLVLMAPSWNRVYVRVIVQVDSILILEPMSVMHV